MLKKLTLVAALFASFTAFSQNFSDGYCGSKTIEQEIQNRTDISESEKARLIAENQAYEQAVSKRADMIYVERNEKDDPVYVIPVVFHIFHKFGPENISEAQVKDCLRAMNEEYNAKNPRLSQVVDDFKPIIGTGKIEFRLATRDPQGNCTNGINRIYNPNTYYTSQAPIQALKPQYIWSRDKYLNCFIVGSIESSNGGRTLGYAQFPGGNAGTDGLVMVHDGIGAIGTGSPSNQSVASHEIGHWLGLSHTWGNCASAGDAAACNCDDGIQDTPNTKGSPSVCDLNEASCGPKANVQNFMDYSFCYAMFTQGQVARMRSVLETNASRKSLWQPANITATGADYDPASPPAPLCKAEFLPSTFSPICEGNSIKFTDYSYGSVTTWSWEFEGGTPATSTEQNPVVTYATPGDYNVKLTVSDGPNSVETTKTDLIKVMSSNALAIPYIQPFAGMTTLAPDFTVNNPNNDKTWEFNSNTGVADSKCIYIQNRSITGTDKVDELITNTVDISNLTAPVLRFNYAYARKNANSVDELNVYASSDCGITWVKRKVIKGSTLKTGNDTPTGDYVPTASEWKLAEVNLSSLKTDGLRLKYEWINKAGNNVYLDNVYIGEATGIEENLESMLNMEVYPNPADQSAQFSFELNASANTKVELFDLLGKKVRTVQSGALGQGAHQFELGRENVTPGIYFVKLSVDNHQYTKKIIFK